MGIKDLFFKITAKDNTGAAFSSVNKRLRETDGLSASVSQKIGRAGQSMQRFGAAGSVASLGVAAAFRDVIGLYDEQARSEAKVAQAIRATGGAAGFTTEQLQDQASALQGLTRFGDEAILNGVTAQLLTFKNIAGDAFIDAQTSALDLATVLDGDLQSASIMLGKALNDPVKGLSAMSRAGITFSDAQAEVIKDLAKTGDIAGAQRLILDEIASAYGGQAEAARLAGAGIVDAWRNTWGDIKEIVGAALVDILPPIIDALERLVGWFKNLTPEGQKMTVMLGALAVAIPPITVALGVMVSALAALSGPIGIAIAGLSALAAGVAYFWPENDKLTRSVDDLNAALDDQKNAIDILAPAMGGDIGLSGAAKSAKLTEARARYENIRAIAAEARALAQQSFDDAQGTFNTSQLDPNGGFTDRDGAEFFNTGPRSIEDVIGKKASEAGKTLARAESRLAAAEREMASLGQTTGAAGVSMDDLGVAIEVTTNGATNLTTSLGGGSGGGLKGSINDLTVGVNDLSAAEGWTGLKDNLKALVVDGQSWGDTWKGILSSASDRVFDLAFSPAWDALFDNLDTYLTKSASPSTGGGAGGGLLGGLVSGASNWVGNILGLDTGGDVNISGKAGVDRNMTVLRTSDAETVSVRRKGEGSMRPVNVTIMTQDLRSFQGSQAQVAGQMRRALAQSERAL
ncbi:hypothetical protein [Roseobacter litoralis]|uniref:hypothetical protein n=1 Tax=Roseobacter litoralis TaxID=42443 RepID=UPI0024950645|nr:hypothetical protein [Roseobacter litoralis]